MTRRQYDGNNYNNKKNNNSNYDNQRRSHLRQPSSSLPSLQSNMPSHLYVSCMHCLRSAHLNCVGEQVIGGQPSSSWLSKQSLSPSHTHVCGIQCPDRGQVNWNARHDTRSDRVRGDERPGGENAGRVSESGKPLLPQVTLTFLVWNTHLEIRAGLFGAEIALVRTVAAIVFRVALPRGRHTPPVVAQELGGRARDVRAPGLVAVVAAVVLAVAPESPGDAAAGAALPFSGGAGRFCGIKKKKKIVLKNTVKSKFPDRSRDFLSRFRSRRDDTDGSKRPVARLSLRRIPETRET